VIEGVDSKSAEQGEQVVGFELRVDVGVQEAVSLKGLEEIDD
jgi:hypothetical protein